jgi:hypothetical protein
MKKVILSTLGLLLANIILAQVAWVEPKKPDVTKPVRIYCDISKATAATADAMKTNTTGPYYIWTWKPVEARVDSLLNGTGDKPWKSSNDKLIMIKDDTKGNNVWYYEMIPTEFYGVAPAVVYAQGISLLVKPKDGGGYGDPDVKTEDINLTIDPPSVDRGILYALPKTLFEDQINTLVYDNPNEPKVSMQNLADGDVYMHMLATAQDAAGSKVTIEPTKFFKVTDNSKLKMKKLADGRFKITFIPAKFFVIPSGYHLVDVEITVRRKTYTSAVDQTDKKTKLLFGCQ